MTSGRRKADLTPTTSDAERHRAIARVLAPKASRNVGAHALLLLEAKSDDPSTIALLQRIAREHYVAAETTAKRLAGLGAPKTAALLAEHLPVSKRSRSGDLGEILATEVSESHLGYKVPIRRLRWKDGRNMALRGDDIIGLMRRNDGRLQFLKGESKSRASLTRDAIDDAGKALDRYRGRPTRHSVLFVAERLRELGQDDLAGELEEAVLESFQGHTIEHLLSAVTGSDPDRLLNEHLVDCSGKKRTRHALGILIKDHGNFIGKLYEAL